MSRLKKPFAFIVVAGVSAAAALVGNALLKDAQYARARDAIESTRSELSGADAGQLSNIFRKVGKVMEPSVVNIIVHRAAKTGPRALPFDNDALRKFFPDRDGDGQPDLPEGFGDGGGFDDVPRDSMGTGSGVIMHVDGGSGFILTNNHVAGGATEMTITLADGRQIKNGKLLGTDAKTDLAVIEIKEPRLIPAKWGDSDVMERGDFVMAFGSPFGYVGSMTHGIVSALNRQAGILADRQGYESFIQVDCPINPGNSGGPLTNLKGEVVGINTAIASRTGSFSGIGFAIPSNQAKYVFEQLKGKGKVVRGWLGVSISDVARDLPKAQSFGFKGDKGVLVEQTFANTPANGKLKPGDIVTELDGKPVSDVQELRNKVAAIAPNATVKMRVYRNGEFTSVDLTIGEQPDDLMAVATKQSDLSPRAEEAKSPAKLGLRFANPNDPTLERFGLSGKNGAVVVQVAPQSPSAKAGIRVGDVITQVGETEVKNGVEAAAALSKQDLSKGVRLYVTSAGGGRFVFIEVDGK
ncbi:trypsin-like peptidase domain-containing protein [Humisphaera borealis]|uniref:PDZ domain-containing protein n=1 Tax=Humisphaera borealis TaxID=2807512 RepID=A0A7M2X256_9BACT|nr:trypsin-like peptidase domain-containing protein [Humisphaera borealis]QOV91837.1 PDZ domain-containing protein [Humisphaera borealis]